MGKIFFSGEVLRIDQEVEEVRGLMVIDAGPITQWTNLTGMASNQEQIFLSTCCQGRDIEYTLVDASPQYLRLYKEVYRMVFF